VDGLGMSTSLSFNGDEEDWPNLVVSDLVVLNSLPPIPLHCSLPCMQGDNGKL